MRAKKRESKFEALEEVIRELERRFGSGIVYRLAQARPKIGERSVPTGSLALDYATGIGGVPRGRITEILGPDSSGKTSLAYHILANAQRDGGLAVLIDAEQSADAESMERCGVNLADLIVATPASVEEALKMVEILVRCGALDALMVSSISALLGLPARTRHGASAVNQCKEPGRDVFPYVSRGLDRINTFLKGSPTALVFTNRANLVKSREVNGYSLVPAWAVPSLPFYASLRIELVPLFPILRSAGDVGGVHVRARIAKNKLSSPLREVDFSILENKGIDREAELFDLGYANGLIQKLPLGFAFLEGRQFLGKGRERAIAALEQDRGLAEQLEHRIREAMGKNEVVQCG